MLTHISLAGTKITANSAQELFNTFYQSTTILDLHLQDCPYLLHKACCILTQLAQINQSLRTLYFASHYIHHQGLVALRVFYQYSCGHINNIIQSIDSDNRSTIDTKYKDLLNR